ncbi:MAG: Rho termination factor N-terminal domain-containing protein [Aerococcus sp.]|nr:Rho termination factor N-terminal domain-containing protein [Aerococcus sp.]
MTLYVTKAFIDKNDGHYYQEGERWPFFDVEARGQSLVAGGWLTEEEVTEDPEYERMKVAELRQLAEEKGIDHASKMKKEALIASLKDLE